MIRSIHDKPHSNRFVTIKTLMEFLNEKGVAHRFMLCAYKKHGEATCEKIASLLADFPPDVIVNAFSWMDTIEGVAFWEKLDRQWTDYLTFRSE